MDDFLYRAARDLHLDVSATGPATWAIKAPAALARVFGTAQFNVTTDKQLAALDPQLQLLSPNSSLTMALAEQLRTRGRPTHRARILWNHDAPALLDAIAEQGLVRGAALDAGLPQWRLLLRVVYRVRFEREVIEERMLACCVDYVTGQVWPAVTDISALRELLEPLPQTNLTEAHLETALACARRWLELALYPDKARHEADLAQLLAVEQARINAFYDALSEDSGSALGARSEDSEATTLEEERRRLLDELEYRYALSLAAETVSVATLQAPILPIGPARQPELIQHCPLFEPMLQPPHCAACGRPAPVALVKERMLCAICQQVLA